MRSPPGILVVEDDPTTARLIELLLTALGYSVLAVVDRGEDAITAVPRLSPDLVLMDVSLAGEIDGIEAAGAIVAAGHAVPVVFLTARHDQVTMERIRHNLPFGFLTKPPQKEALATAIRLALRGHELERQVHHSFESLGAILDAVGDALLAFDDTGTVSFMNRAAELLTGQPRQQAEGRPLDELLPLHAAGAARTAGAAITAGEGLVRVAGNERYLRWSVSSLTGVGPLAAGTVVVVTDLTERRNQETDRERLGHEVVRIGRALKMLSETQRAVHRANDEAGLFNEACAIAVQLGYRQAWVGLAGPGEGSTVRLVAQAGFDDRPVSEITQGWTTRGRYQGPTAAALRTGQTVIVRDVLGDETLGAWRIEAIKRDFASAIALPLRLGERVLGVLTIYAIEAEAFGEDEVGLLGELANSLAYGLLAVRGRGERERAERDLLKAEARYRALVEQMPVVAYIATLDDLASRVYLSPQMLALTGFPPERYISNPSFYLNRIHAEDRLRVLGELSRCRVGDMLASEYRLLTADGRTVWVRDEARPLRGEQGPHPLIQGVLLDITARRQAEASLRHAHQALRALVYTSPLAIFDLDPLGRVANVWNPAAERLFGWSEAEVTGRPLPIVSSDQDGEFKLLLSRVLAGEAFTGLEITRIRRDGSTIELSLAAAPLTAADGTVVGVMAMLADISERKRAEAGLAESRREATLGRMAAVVAHEVNNPLAAITAWLGLLKTDLADRPAALANLDLLAGQVERITRTIRNLLGFARQRETPETRVPLAQLISTVADLFVGRMRGKGLQFHRELPAVLPAVRGDADQLQEVLINLLENACQALDQGHQVWLTAASDDPTLVTIQIADDGPGLGPDPERLFTPFFTTRINGTGLGLTVARRICIAHGGRLDAGNRPEGGAQFRIVLPVDFG